MITFISARACHHSVQNLLSSRLLSKNILIRILKTVTVYVECICMKTGLHFSVRTNMFDVRKLRRILRLRGNNKACEILQNDLPHTLCCPQSEENQ
jgi:hypothetical protein